MQGQDTPVLMVIKDSDGQVTCRLNRNTVASHCKMMEASFFNIDFLLMFCYCNFWDYVQRPL